MLAPMAGVNDPSFRSICKRLGASLTYTEMISSKGLMYANPKTDRMLEFFEDEAPFAVQLFGNDPDTIARISTRLMERFGDVLALIDVNMACPARKVARKGDGAALMRTPELAFKILESAVKAVDIPVTVKFRKGYGLEEDTAVEFALMAQSAGVAAMTIHGRTALQFYHGTSDREVINRVSAAVSIPVIASGDVFSCSDIEDYFSRGAAGVLVARGAQGNPWIFSQYASGCAYPSIKDRVAVSLEHAERLNDLDPDKLVSMRRHIAWYFKGTPHAASLRRSLNTCTTLDDYRFLLDEVLQWA